jgi:hypothetical protein
MNWPWSKPEQPPFSRIVKVAVEVKICYPLPEGCRAIGQESQGKIILEGRIINGAICPITLEALGHEFQHVLNEANPEFANPDKDKMTR